MSARAFARTCGVLFAFTLSAAPGLAAQRTQRLETVSAPLGRRLSTAQLGSSTCSRYAAPDEISSRGSGTLSTQLVMALDTFRIGDSTYIRNVYNKRYNAPVLRMNPEEQLNINVTNNMSPYTATDTSYKGTNQHYHGLIVTPLPTRGDNVTNINLAPGQSNLNSFPVPDFQSQGMMWYHPHPHGKTSAQVAGGLAGPMIIGDLLAAFPDYAGATERILVIKDTRNGGKSYLNINGNPCTVLTIRPGEKQLWRIGNFTSGTWVNLKLGEPGANYPFIALALDGNHLSQPTEMDSLFIPPGSRAEVIVIGGSGVWTGARLYSDSVASSFNPSTGVLRAKNPRVDLGTLITTGDMLPVAPRAQRPELIPENMALVDSIRRLEATEVVERFTLHFQSVGNGLGLNDSLYSPTRIDRRVAVGVAQEWTLINDTNFLHTFHIHQVDFVVTRINGVPQPDSVHLDNVHLGIHQLPSGTWAGDTVVVRFKFKPIAAGPFVYHCHDLSHEDAGMMANVCVYDPAQGQTPAWCNQFFTGHSSHAAAEGNPERPRVLPTHGTHRRE
ncbi:MAG TPA: multicopper oxidase family protein [Longimicrobium sp.]|nr:multicopper oxidase family protein [Longimicrobium sp.]